MLDLNALIANSNRANNQFLSRFNNDDLLKKLNVSSYSTVNYSTFTYSDSSNDRPVDCGIIFVDTVFSTTCSLMIYGKRISSVGLNIDYNDKYPNAEDFKTFLGVSIYYTFHSSLKYKEYTFYDTHTYIHGNLNNDSNREEDSQDKSKEKMSLYYTKEIADAYYATSPTTNPG